MPRLDKNEIINSFSSTITNPQPISIAILNTPCNGFGDIIFALKLKRYLESWYHFATIKIITTKTKSFISLGEKENTLIQLGSISNVEDCRRFQRLTPTSILPFFDLIFVAPLQFDFAPSIADVRHLIPYADKFNTYFFSEYNDELNKKFDFNTGIGKGRDGMFFVDIPFKQSESNEFLNRHNLHRDKYAICYIAETIDNAKQCYLSFFEMVANKYKQSHFTIVCPEWIANSVHRYLNRIYPYFSTVVISTKTETKIYEQKDIKDKKEKHAKKKSMKTSKNKKITNKNTLYIRGDVFPVPNRDMLMLIKNSCDDLLTTGDQSISDSLIFLKKNIWYQIAPWKEDLAKELSRLLPNQFYRNKKTSCGTLTGISLRSDYREFVKKWDFRKIAKPKLNKIINLAICRKNKDKKCNF
jgi:hypothetical protein